MPDIMRGLAELYEYDVSEDHACALLDERELAIFEGLSPLAQWSIERAMAAPIWPYLRREGLRLEREPAQFSALSRWGWRGHPVVLGVGLEMATLEGESTTWACMLAHRRMEIRSAPS